MVKVISCGYEAGNYARIMINEIVVDMDVNENGHFRGLHIVVINPKNGKAKCGAVFDTYKSSEAFLGWIKKIHFNVGDIIAAACKDEFS